jgi:hypothetical protein
MFVNNKNASQVGGRAMYVVKSNLDPMMFYWLGCKVRFPGSYVVLIIFWNDMGG